VTDDSAMRRRLAVPETWHPANVRRRLVEPPESIREPERRRRAAPLLSTLLVIPMLLRMVALISPRSGSTAGARCDGAVRPDHPSCS